MTLREQLAEIDPEILMADGYDEALLGYAEGWHPDGHRYTVATYDRDKYIEIIQRDGGTWEEAVEFFEFNVAGAYVGPYTPVFVTRLI